MRASDDISDKEMRRAAKIAQADFIEELMVYVLVSPRVATTSAAGRNSGYPSLGLSLKTLTFSSLMIALVRWIIRRMPSFDGSSCSRNRIGNSDQ